MQKFERDQREMTEKFFNRLKRREPVDDVEREIQKQQKLILVEIERQGKQIRESFDEIQKLLEKIQ